MRFPEVLARVESLKKENFQVLKENRAVLLLKTDTRDQAWIDAFSSAMPDLEVRLWPETGDRSEINCALLWGPPPELFDELDNLEVIFSIGAGVDSLLTCPTLPAHLPIVRMVESELTAGMVEFCLFHVLRFHRLMHLFENHRVSRHWEALTQLPASDITVGIMGFGVLGQALARQLSVLRYRVIGYRRGAGEVDGMEVFHGTDQLEAFMGRSNILVALMPSTPETRKMINSRTLSWLPPGACFINAGRGDLVDEEGLVEALDRGSLAGAALDVFETEPLPQESILWTHPNVYVTPHIASLTHPPTACRYIAGAISRHRQDKPWPHLVDTGRGY
jgi:glyoxylate/hydroxypyruvate reductase A